MRQTHSLARRAGIDRRFAVKVMLSSKLVRISTLLPLDSKQLDHDENQVSTKARAKELHVNDPSDNPYRSPDGASTPATNVSFVYLFACLVWCGFTIKMAILRPILSSFFEEFGVELPLLTRWLLKPEQNVFFVLLTLGLLSGGLLVKTKEGRQRLGWRALALALLMAVVMLLGIGLPLLNLVQALS